MIFPPNLIHHQEAEFLHGCLIRIVNSNLILIVMRGILYIIAVILVIGWLLGFFAYSAGGLIHILLVLAVISILVSVIGGGRRV
jgi:hypothetical protein